MARTLATVARDRGGRFVGRARERAALRALLEPDGPAVTWVHGLAGIGKSALLGAFAEDARAAGAAVVTVDGATTEPTPDGFRRAAPELEDERRPLVLVIDAVERLRLLDDWLRRVLIASLPEHARVVLAGRDRPVAAWTAAYGPLLRVVELDALGQDDAVALLAQHGVGEERARVVNRAVRGHPLSLRLAAVGGPADGGALDEVARTTLGGLDAATRDALDAACATRRVTRSLLAATLDEPAAAGDAYERLRGLPFVSGASDGLVVHDVVREAVAAELRASDPARYRRLRAAAWRRLRDEVAAASDATLWRYTADMLHLLETPAVRDAFFPTGAQRYSVEPARAADGQPIAAIAKRHEPAAAVALVRAWWDAVPGAFFVARDAAGAVAGFSALCAPAAIPVRIIDADPVAGAWRAHLRGDPPAPGRRALFIRFLCGADSGGRPGPDTSALYLDLKRTYLSLRPELRRVYACVREGDGMSATLEPLGFTAFGEPPLVGDVAYPVFCNDMGPGSVDGWLARLAARDVLAGEEPVLDPDRRQLVLDGARVDLSPLEFGVLRCLHEAAACVVRREDLLREVWGADWEGAGNALESVVSALRRRLGPRAAALETVRGVGYRLRPLG